MSDEQGISYTVWLPDGISADEYVLADRAIVTYKGEPALIQNIWSQQIADIQIAE